jgi:hypothetical protein
VDDEGPVAESPQTIDIFLSGDSFYISKIQCGAVYDKRGSNGQGSFMPDLVNRRCGLKFDQLTEEQEKHITFFLENHTVGRG